MLKRLSELNADGLMTTEKDAVRLKTLDFPEEQIFRPFRSISAPRMRPEHRKSFLSEMDNLLEAALV